MSDYPTQDAVGESAIPKQYVCVGKCNVRLYIQRPQLRYTLCLRRGAQYSHGNPNLKKLSG